MAFTKEQARALLNDDSVIKAYDEFTKKGSGRGEGGKGLGGMYGEIVESKNKHYEPFFISEAGDFLRFIPESDAAAVETILSIAKFLEKKFSIDSLKTFQNHEHAENLKGIEYSF
jgi:hypothetical protein